MRLGEKMRVRLATSEKMDSRGPEEDSYIRIPAAARDNFQTAGESIVLETDRGKAVLTTKKAFREDVSELARQLSAGSISRPKVARTCFVTTNTLKKLAGRAQNTLDRSNSYLSYDVDNLTLGADPEFMFAAIETREIKEALRKNTSELVARNGFGTPAACTRMRTWLGFRSGAGPAQVDRVTSKQRVSGEWSVA